MKKRFLSLAIVIAMVLTLGVAFSSVASAAGTQTVYLKGSGSSFSDSGWQNIFYVGGADSLPTGETPSIWHLVYSGNFDDVTAMQITFTNVTNGEVFNWTPDMGKSTNGGDNNPGWVIEAPSDWKIAYVNSGNNNVSGSFLVTNDSSNVNFNISGFSKGNTPPPPPPDCSVIVTAQEQTNYQEITLQPYEQRTVQKFYQYDVTNYYQGTTQDIYQGTTQDVYQGTKQKVYQGTTRDIYQGKVWDILQGTTQNFYVPSFVLKTTTINDTLVTKIDADHAGGKFGNFMTYLAVDVAKATNNWVEYQIAYSDPSNTTIDCFYQVMIDKDNVLHFRLEDTTATASVTVKLYPQIPATSDPSHHEAVKAGGELTVAMPASDSKTAPALTANATMDKKGTDVTVTVSSTDQVIITPFVKNGNATCKFDNGDTVQVAFNGSGIKSTTVIPNPDGSTTNIKSDALTTVYMFVHFESLKYTNVGQYVFNGWKLVDTQTTDPEKVGIRSSDPVKIATKTTDAKYLRTDTTDPTYLRTDTADPTYLRTDTTDAKLVKIVPSLPYLVDTKNGDYVTVKTTRSSSDAQSGPYTVEVPVTATNVDDSSKVYTGTTGSKITLPEGTYKFVVTYANDETDFVIGTVGQGDSNSFAIADVHEITGVDTPKTLDAIKLADRVLPSVITMGKLNKETLDPKKLPDVTLDNKVLDTLTLDPKVLDPLTLDPKELKSITLKPEKVSSETLTIKVLDPVYNGSNDPNDPNNDSSWYTPAK